LERALPHMKQGDGPVVANNRSFNPFHHHFAQRSNFADQVSTSMTEPDLIPFVNAQAQVYSRYPTDVSGLTGYGSSFPQLAGLGHGATAQRDSRRRNRDRHKDPISISIGSDFSFPV
jgi:hypothetical protein